MLEIGNGSRGTSQPGCRVPVPQVRYSEPVLRTSVASRSGNRPLTRPDAELHVGGLVRQQFPGGIIGFDNDRIGDHVLRYGGVQADLGQPCPRILLSGRHPR